MEALRKEWHHGRSILAEAFYIHETITFGAAPSVPGIKPIPNAAPEHFSLKYQPETRQLWVYSIHTAAQVVVDRTQLKPGEPLLIRDTSYVEVYLQGAPDHDKFRMAINPQVPEIWSVSRRGAKVVLSGVSFDVSAPGRRRTVNCLREIDFAPPHSQLTCIYGKSGTGKSTLLKLLAGSNMPTSGDIWIDMLRPGGAELRTTVSLLPQHVSFPGELSCNEVLSVAAAGRGINLDLDMNGRIVRDSVCELCLLPTDKDFFARRISRLSGGQQRRLALAVSLLKPDLKLLLVDEPSAGLDPVNEQRIFSSLKQISRHGVTVIACTHSLLARRIADEVCVLRADADGNSATISFKGAWNDDDIVKQNPELSSLTPVARICSFMEPVSQSVAVLSHV